MTTYTGLVYCKSRVHVDFINANKKHKGVWKVHALIQVCVRDLKWWNLVCTHTHTYIWESGFSISISSRLQLFSIEQHCNHAEWDGCMASPLRARSASSSRSFKKLLQMSKNRQLCSHAALSHCSKIQAVTFHLVVKFLACDTDGGFQSLVD